VGDLLANLVAPYAEGLGVSVAAILTLMVYSYLLGDNFLYRLAEHLFVGVAVAYTVVVAFHSVLLPRVLQPLLSAPQDNVLLVIPLLLGLLLLTCAVPRWRWLASVPLAFLTGVGAALAVGGALTGILLPQMQATMLPLNPQLGLERFANNLVIVLGTVCSLVYFYFTARPGSPGGRVVSGMGSIGRWILVATFGALFGNVVMGRVSLLIGRVQFLLGDWLQVIR